MNVAAGKRACVGMLLSGHGLRRDGCVLPREQAPAIDNVLTLDIGGTSADLALIIDGEPQFGTGELIGEFPLYVPSVSVTSIGSWRRLDCLGRRVRRAQSRTRKRGLDARARLLRTRRRARHDHRRDGRVRLSRPRAARLRRSRDASSQKAEAARRSRWPTKLGIDLRADRGGHHPGRRLGNVRRGEQAHRPLWRRPARLHLDAVRWRRADARLLPRA